MEIPMDIHPECYQFDIEKSNKTCTHCTDIIQEKIQEERTRAWLVLVAILIVMLCAICSSVGAVMSVISKGKKS